MEKKVYIKPSMEATAIETQAMIATSLDGTNVRISNTSTEDDARMAGERRGAWGNFWE